MARKKGTEVVQMIQLVLEDGTGKVQRDGEDFYMLCRDGRPMAGDLVKVPDVGSVYVDRVEFVLSDSTSLRPGYEPVLYIRRVGTPPSGGRRNQDSITRAKPPTNTSEARGLLESTSQRNVIPFTIPSSPVTQLESFIFPVNLVANLAVAGYRIQATEFAADRKRAGELLRTDDGDLFRPDLVAVLDALSRIAKRSLIDALVYFQDGVADERSASEEEPMPAGMGKLLELRPAGAGWQVTGTQVG